MYHQAITRDGKIGKRITKGTRGWGEKVNEALAELSTVAEQFILSYKDRGKELSAGF